MVILKHDRLREECEDKKMSIFKKILSVINDLTDHTVLVDDTVLANIRTDTNFLSKEIEQSILLFYGQLPAPVKNSVYHDDYAFFRNTMMEMYKKCLGDDLLTSPEAGLRTFNDVYIDVWARRLAGVSDLTEVYKSVKQRRSYVDDTTLLQLVIISLEKTESEHSLPKTIESDDLSRMIKSAVIGDPEGDSVVEKLYQNAPDYGLVPEKPIFVNGFMGSHMYLSMLKTDQGELLRNERRGSMRVELR